jgi:hypothetical protein
VLLLEKNQRLSSAEQTIVQACTEAERAYQQVVEISNALFLLVFQMQEGRDGVAITH